jgi:hypothetical protein
LCKKTFPEIVRKHPPFRSRFYVGRWIGLVLFVSTTFNRGKTNHFLQNPFDIIISLLPVGVLQLVFAIERIDTPPTI